MQKHSRLLLFVLIIFFFCKTIYSHKSSIKRRLHFFSSFPVQIEKWHTSYIPLVQSKKREFSIYTIENGSLEKIKKLRKVVSEIKRENLQEIDEIEKKKREQETTAWKVILYNDDIHTFTYVADSIVEVIGQISKAKAHTITVEAHGNGQALILSTWKSQAEKYCEQLQKRGLTVSIIHESQLKQKK